MSPHEPDCAAGPSRPLDRRKAGPHARPASEVVEELASDPVSGLAEPEAERRLRDAGPNAIPRAARVGDLRIALRQFGDPLVWLLIAATAVSAVIGEQLDALVIAAILAMNALLGFVQEAGAERAIESLRDAVETTATVIRGGRAVLVSSEALVAGDVVAVREGDRVPADLRVIVADRLRANESLLTGESAPVTKTTHPVAPGAPLADRSCMLYAGTSVTMGEGRGVVVAVAGATETGAIAQLAGTATRPATPLQRRMGRLSRIMVVAGAGITVTLFGAMLGQGAPAHEAFLVGVSVAVAAVPEGLAATITIALAGGASRMARRRAIVRHLAAVETVGAATVAATDKTGTLTLNELRVVAVEALPGRRPDDILAAGALASTGHTVDGGREDKRLVGDPVDRAFILAGDAAAEAGPPPRRLALVPFDPERKRLTAAYASDRHVRVVVKGAPEVLMARSGQSQAELGPLVAANRRFAGRGLRVLAVGEASLDTVAGLGEDELDGHIDVVGVVGLEDPLRDGAAEAVRRARQAGVRVVMLTGDQPATAAAIATQLGIEPAPLMTGAEMGALSDAELRRRQRPVGVFARVSPQDKLRLVTALQSDGQVVVVTGDGVNDTPALRQADVGVAMGRDGTEAAREAADIVLTDDAFSSIVAAIEEGRRIAQNMRAFVTFLLSANLGEVLLFAGSVLVGAGAPMSVVQVLAVNLLTDGLPAVALAYDPIARETMTRSSPPPARLLVAGGLRRLLAIGAMVAGAAAVAYALGGGDATADAQTMAYATIALSELAIVYSLRALGAPAWSGPPNWRLTAAVAASVAVIVGTVYLPAAHDILGTAALDAPAAVAVALLALAPLAAAEAWKAVRGAS